MRKNRLIESDDFPFEFLSKLGERESWRKEVHRPIYHVHKWWAKRLGTVFRGILLGCSLDKDDDLESSFYDFHSIGGTVFDPFMGSGTTVGEAHKLGFSALGRDINPVAVEAVRVALGPLDRGKVEEAFRELTVGVGREIMSLYRSLDSKGRACDVLYYFWVMQTKCPECKKKVDLFPSYIIARNAYPQRKPEVQIVCPKCGDVFRGLIGQRVSCRCGHEFDPEEGCARGAKATCTQCAKKFSILSAVGRKRPPFRLYAKLVLNQDGGKEYLKETPEDLAAYADCLGMLSDGKNPPPILTLEEGVNTRQAMSYGFLRWRDFFNNRQILALSLLRSAILKVKDDGARCALLTLFSGVLEFNNLFASYKGEGTGAVRHMFAHHILKPERTPIEANVWGTHKSSGSFSNLFRSRLLRAIDYRALPTEVNGTQSAKGRVCSPPFTGELWPWGSEIPQRGISLSCGDSASSGLPDGSIDLVVTDPPFFDNVHYSELADFFHAWQGDGSTRSAGEVQDSDSENFARKLRGVFRECHRVLKVEGLLVFTYHHSRDEGWKAVADAVLGGGFVFVNSQPVKAEMSVAMPKSQASEPIQLDIILVCRKVGHAPKATERIKAVKTARAKLKRLEEAGFKLSRNDRKIVLCGQLLTTLRTVAEAEGIAAQVEKQMVILANESRTLF